MKRRMPMAKNTFWELVYHLNANSFVTQWKFKSSCKQNKCATWQWLSFLKSLFKEIFNLDFNFRKTLHHLFFWKTSKQHHKPGSEKVYFPVIGIEMQRLEQSSQALSLYSSSRGFFYGHASMWLERKPGLFQKNTARKG